MKRVLTAVTVFFSLLSPMLAHAAGIEVTPARLTLIVAAGKTGELELAVRNPTADVQVFEVYPDSFTDTLSVEPKSFTLEAGAGRSVKISLQKPLEANQKLQTDISVVASALSPAALQANSGIKIPISVEVGQKTFFGIPRAWFYSGTVLYGIVVAIFLSAIGYYYWQKRKQTEQN
ncbi:MAG: hypothetical protein UY65_C0009G0003 [Parcubacteria group bacterium GW2011_GWA2_51_12]|nr:MAG: hypothetical protein UY65_C0009G0003 [Parcubacteria group bacterium GW2011_GWA2_51_12]